MPVGFHIPGTPALRLGFQAARFGYGVYKASRTPGGKRAQRVLMRRFAPKMYNRRQLRDQKYGRNYFYRKFISIHH